ncbi:MAG: DUF4430 domain-containing protein [Candidatus Pacebacteria bacterium]|nr:DUF4430 domain-containing protein [Candidatus Paceibacterota bacterium]
MKKKSSWKYNSVLFVLTLILLASIIFALKTETASKNEVANNTTEELRTDISVSLKIINKEEEIYKLNNILNELTVFDITEENTELEYNNNYDFGVFIESIDGVKNGNEGMYWQYYVNDKLGDVAADKKNLEDGDVVEWRFEDVSSFN